MLDYLAAGIDMGGRPVVYGKIDVPDRPGLGVTFIPEAAKPYLRPEDSDFFD